jgi:ribosomal protein S6--L-glutamate ligase
MTRADFVIVLDLAGKMGRRRKRRMPPVTPPFILGWEEWVALPELGLPAIKAKVDTGARTSALHAFFVERLTTGRRTMARFGVHPIPRRADIVIVCTAQVVDERQVTSSNGERESRLVISTPIRIGEREWPIEVTLTNRDAMSYRMLLGRQAIAEGILVDPAASFRQPRLRYQIYEDAV